VVGTIIGHNSRKRQEQDMWKRIGTGPKRPEFDEDRSEALLPTLPAIRTQRPHVLVPRQQPHPRSIERCQQQAVQTSPGPHPTERAGPTQNPGPHGSHPGTIREGTRQAGRHLRPESGYSGPSPAPPPHEQEQEQRWGRGDHARGVKKEISVELCTLTISWVGGRSMLY